MTAVLIAGGGIAGIAAALRLAQSGVRVTLVETRKKLGGRATSFVDPRTGETLDNCQHVVMGCCTAYLDFLSRLGVLDQIEWTREQYWIERGGRESVVRPSAIPAPFHFGLSVLAARFLTLREKAAMAWGAHRIAHARRDRWQDATFAEFLAKSRQPQSLIDKFWSPVVVSACNLPCERVCAATALHVFQDGFFGNPRAADIGVSRVPLLQLYDRAERVITAARGAIRLGFSVDHLTSTTIRGGRTATGAGETLSADAVICALPVDRAAEVIDPALVARDPRLFAGVPEAAPTHSPHSPPSRLSQIGFSPILGVHLTFDRPVLTRPHAVLVNAGVQWLFRKDAAGTRIHAVISGADEWMPLSEPEIAQRVLADIRAHLPAAAGATLVSVRAVKEKQATFAAVPGIDRLRPATLPPAQAGAAPDPHAVILAGDYTATGWPATMEGAARSGYLAAAAALQRLGISEPASGEPILPPDLPRSGLAPWLIR